MSDHGMAADRSEGMPGKADMCPYMALSVCCLACVPIGADALRSERGREPQHHYARETRALVPTVLAGNDPPPRLAGPGW